MVTLLFFVSKLILQTRLQNPGQTHQKNLWRFSEAHKSLSPHYLLYLIELVEGLERCEVVDIDAEYLVAHLAEYGVVELEDAHLHAFTAVGNEFGRLAYALGGSIALHLLKYLLGTAHDALGHTGHVGYMDTEGVIGASGLELAHEDDLLIDLAHGDVEVLDA